MSRGAITLSMLFMLLLRMGWADDMKRILRLLDKPDVDKAVEILREGMVEDSNHAGYLWIAAKMTSTDSLSYYDIDSAYVLIKQAMVAYENATEDHLKTFEKVEFDLAQIISADQDIRNLQWARTQAKLSIESILDFREKYPEAPQETEAIFLRDSLAFEQTRNEHTWNSYKKYIETYPESTFYKRALQNYETLLYQDKTAAGDLKSYESFVAQYPNNPYREEAIGHIFSFMLFWNDTEPLINFINSYPESTHTQRALAYLYHMAPPLIEDPFLFKNFIAIDSLKKVESVRNQLYFLYPKEGKVGMLNLSNNTQQMLDLDFLVGQQIYCDVYFDDYIVGIAGSNGWVINKLGEKFHAGIYSNHKEIGLGAIFLQSEEGGRLIHKTGDIIIEGVEDAALVDDQWIKVKRQDKWALISLNGTLLCPFEYDDIKLEGRFWIFEKDGLFAFANRSVINSEAGTGGFTLIFKYDDYEVVNDHWMIGFKDQMEGLISDDLAFIIPWDEQAIYPEKQFPYAKRNDKYYLYPQLEGFVNEVYDQILINNRWLAMKQDQWQVVNLETMEQKHGFDSVRLIGDQQLFVKDSSHLKLLFTQDSSYVLQANEEVRILSNTSKVQGVQEAYVLIRNQEQYRVYATDGSFLFEDDLSDLRPIGDSLFTASKNRKVGVLNQRGIWLIDNKYDFVSKNGSILNLLMDKKIGAYLISDSLLISPDYSANLTALGPYYLTSSNTGYGLLDSLGSEILPFQFNQLDYISDSLVWVKTDSSWQVEGIYDRQVYQYGIRAYDQLVYSDDTVFRVTTSGGYGILDQRGRYLIPPSYSDVRVISTDVNRIYICEKAVPEAAFYIWVGYNKYGVRLFSEAYREHDYETFVCD